MINDSIKSDKLIGMIQPKILKKENQELPELYSVGCMGKIVNLQKTDDERYLIELKGLIRFNLIDEILTKKKLSKGNITKSLLNDYKMPVISIVIRKAFLPDITNVFNAKYDLLADFDFSINFSLKHKFDCIQDPVAIYRRHEFQLSRKLFGKQEYNYKRYR